MIEQSHGGQVQSSRRVYQPSASNPWRSACTRCRTPCSQSGAGRLTCCPAVLCPLGWKSETPASNTQCSSRTTEDKSKSAQFHEQFKPPNSSLSLRKSVRLLRAQGGFALCVDELSLLQGILHTHAMGAIMRFESTVPWRARSVRASAHSPRSCGECRAWRSPGSAASRSQTLCKRKQNSAKCHAEQETKVFISTRHQNSKAYLSWIQTGRGVFESDYFPASVHGGEFESEVDSTISQPQYMVESLNLK